MLHHILTHAQVGLGTGDAGKSGSRAQHTTGERLEQLLSRVGPPTHQTQTPDPRVLAQGS